MEGAEGVLTRQDWGTLILAGNDAAMQWYALTHGIQNLPTRTPTSLAGRIFGEPTPTAMGGTLPNTGATLVVVVAIAAVAFFALRK